MNDNSRTSDFYKGKKVLVTGGTGMIGRPLVEMLLARGAEVTIASLDDPSRANPQAKFIRINLTIFENCMKVCKNMDYVFHLAGVKGSPAMTVTKPASFFVPLVLFNTNMMEAARLSGVQNYLYTSTIGVYGESEISHEDDVWRTFPSENDKFAGWAKRMGELQADAYKIEYGWQNVQIVRPANVYGPYDNFDLNNAMVVPSLIRRAADGENPLAVWGDGSAVRDFIHADDVARGTLLAMEKQIRQPVNLGSGKGTSIKELVEIIVRQLPKKPEVKWDQNKPKGDSVRILNMRRAKDLIGFVPEIDLESGIRRTMEWYRSNKNQIGTRYNVFLEKEFI